MGVVVFDATSFKVRYPEFSTVNDAILSEYFAESTLYLNNTEMSRVSDVVQRSMLLNMIVAHIAALNSGVNGQAPSGLVGRINSATEGSVSVTADYGAVSNTQAWYLQTRYGASYWQAIKQYRQAVYRAGYSVSAPPTYNNITGGTL
jgi:hypothetical protein